MPNYIYIYVNLYWGCFIALDLPRRWTTTSYVFEESYVGQKTGSTHWPYHALVMILHGYPEKYLLGPVESHRRSLIYIPQSNSYSTEVPIYRPILQAYSSGLCKGISLEIWPYMVLTYLHVRILKFPLSYCNSSPTLKKRGDRQSHDWWTPSRTPAGNGSGKKQRSLRLWTKPFVWKDWSWGMAFHGHGRLFDDDVYRLGKSCTVSMGISDIPN